MTTSDSDNRPEFLAGHATVAEAAALLPGEPLLVAPHMSVAELVQQLGQHTAVRTILVADENRRLLGIIPLTRLVDDLFLRVAPEVFLRHALDQKTRPDDLQVHTAQTAEQLMEKPLFVTGDTTMREAFGLMREHQLEAIPIVDDELRVVGELDLAELLLQWLRVLHSSS